MADSSHRDIDSINFLKMYWVALTHKTTFPAVWRLFASAMTEFFIPQFTTKFGLSNRPVVSVDHPLDDTIPFNPEYVHTYLNFYPYWIRCAYFLYKEFGRVALPEIRDFMLSVSELYYEAGKVYRRCQSTTKRPKYLKNAKFRLIHMVDPHVHCVPSLHVLLVVCNYLNFWRLVDKFGNGNAENFKQQKKLVYNKAVEITESILFMKQHSVNCIPAALYFMSRLRPSFTETAALAFVDDLFANNGNAPSTSEEIKKFIKDQYRHFLDAESSTDGDYRDVLVDFLFSFQPPEIERRLAAD